MTAFVALEDRLTQVGKRVHGEIPYIWRALASVLADGCRPTAIGSSFGAGATMGNVKQIEVPSDTGGSSQIRPP